MKRESKSGNEGYKEVPVLLSHQNALPVVVGHLDIIAEMINPTMVLAPSFLRKPDGTLELLEVSVVLDTRREAHPVKEDESRENQPS